MTKKFKYFQRFCPKCGAEVGKCYNCGENLPFDTTEFGLWLREQPELSSTNEYGYGGHYVGTDIDYFWRDYKTKNFIMVEEKRYTQNPGWDNKKHWSQQETYNELDIICKNTVYRGKYLGTHLVQFENTHPDNGKAYINGRKVGREEVIELFRLMKKI